MLWNAMWGNCLIWAIPKGQNLFLFTSVSFKAVGEPRNIAKASHLGYLPQILITPHFVISAANEINIALLYLPQIRDPANSNSVNSNSNTFRRQRHANNIQTKVTKSSKLFQAYPTTRDWIETLLIINRILKKFNTNPAISPANSKYVSFSLEVRVSGQL